MNCKVERVEREALKLDHVKLSIEFKWVEIRVCEINVSIISFCFAFIFCSLAELKCKVIYVLISRIYSVYGRIFARSVCMNVYIFETIRVRAMKFGDSICYNCAQKK